MQRHRNNQTYFIRSRKSLFIVKIVDALLNLCIKSSGQPARPVRRVLLLAHQHLGDVLLSSSLLPELHRAFPGIQIGFLVGSWSKAIIEAHPKVKWVHTFDHSRLNRSTSSTFIRKIRHLRTFFSSLIAIKKVRYDAAVALSPFFANGIPLAFAARIPQRIGFSTGGFGALLTSQVAWPKETRHICDGYLRLLEELRGFKSSGAFIQPDLEGLCGTESDFAGAVVVHPGAGCPNKQWPPKRWAEVIKQLCSDGQKVVITGKGKSDARCIREIVELLPEGNSVENLCDKLTWIQYIDLVRSASLLVSVDTMSVHVASAYNTPSVVIYARDRYLNSLFYPRNPNARLLTATDEWVCAGDVLAQVSLTFHGGEA